MAKKAYVGVSNVARKVKKMYVGVNSVARKVKKGYIGINGIARQFFSSGELVYYGTASNLYRTGSAPSSLDGTNVGNYLLIASSQTQISVEARDASLTQSFPSNRFPVDPFMYRSAACASVGVYATFLQYDKGAAYNGSLTRTYLTDPSNSTDNPSAATAGSYAIYHHSYSNHYAPEVYNASLTHSNATMSSSRYYYAESPCTISFNNNALFICGYTGSSSSGSNYVYIYNSSLTLTETTFPISATGVVGTTLGNYALVGGGRINASNYSSSAYKYDSSLTCSSISAFSVRAAARGATSIGERALFGGGQPEEGSYYTAVVDVYDLSLTRTKATNLSLARSGPLGCHIGNYALFAGGYGAVTTSTSTEHTWRKTIDAYLWD